MFSNAGSVNDIRAHMLRTRLHNVRTTVYGIIRKNIPGSEHTTTLLPEETAEDILDDIENAVSILYSV